MTKKANPEGVTFFYYIDDFAILYLKWMFSISGEIPAETSLSG